MASREREVSDLFSAFLDAVSHKLRTNISVVVNDLTYLQAVVPTEECQRPLRKCEEIVQMFQEFRELFGAHGEEEILDLGLVAREVLGSRVQGSWRIRGNKAQMQQAFKALHRVLETLTFNGAPSFSAWEVSMGPQEASSDQFIPFYDLTEYVFSVLRLEIPEVPLLEALFESKEVKIKVRTDNTKVCYCFLPISPELNL